MSTLREVAVRAGVSDATVSRVLNSVDISISPDTRRRVQRAAAEIGYQPNRAARALATGRTQTIALWAVNLRSPHSAHVVYQMREEIMRNDYDLLISSNLYSKEGNTDTSKLLTCPVDAIMALDLPRDVLPGVKNSLLGGKPFATLGGYIVHNADYVRTDFLQQSIEAVRHLYSVGCRRIAFLAPNWFDWFRAFSDARLAGYEGGMAEIGAQPEFILTDNETRQSVGLVLKEYIAQHGCPDGLFCFNDDLAIGAFRALRDLSIRIPEDVAIVGCDGIDDTSYIDPPLTTIVQPVQEMCSTAWSFLRQRITDPGATVKQMTLQPRLEVRESTRR